MEQFCKKQRGRKWRIVFQITTQESIEAKLRETISRLEECGVDYAQLTIVTSRALSSERQAKLKITARQLEVALDIIERKALVNRLSDFENGIFYRHFPDIEKQVQVLVGKATKEELDARSVVRSALAFTACAESERARTRVLQELVLGLLVQLKGEAASPQTLSDLHHRLLPQALPLAPEQIRAALDRWVGPNIVERTGDGRYRPTGSGLERSLASAIDWRFAGQILASDIADMVEEAVGTELVQPTRVGGA